MMPFRRVVVGVDFTDPSPVAVRWASVQFAPETEIVLAHVAAEPQLDRLCELAARMSRARTSVEVFSGPIADGLVAIARRIDADAICVDRNIGRIDSTRLDAAVESRLLALAEVPVIVVPARPSAAPTPAAPDADSRARPTPFIVGRSSRRQVLVLPRRPRRPGPGGGDAA
jgi:nucleotide-binding universal stress UspA family protein